MISLLGPVTPADIKRSKDLFYLERDKRSGETNARVRSNMDANVALIASKRAVSSENGQILLLTVVNTLLRMGRFFSRPAILVPEVMLRVRVAGLPKCSIREAAMAIASAADPHCAVSNEADEADVTIVLGESKIPAKHAICPSVQKDAAVLSARPKNSTGGKNPAAATVSAYAAVAEVYKTVFPHLEKRSVPELHIPFPALRHLDLGRSLLVGAGGIGHALSWALQFCDAHGELGTCDFEPVEPSNLNRYLCAFVDDVTRDKAEQLAAYLTANSALKAFRAGGIYGPAVARTLQSYDRVITCLDNVVTRFEVQSDFPRIICNAGTSSYSFLSSTHNFTEKACLGCLFPPRTGVSHVGRVGCDNAPPAGAPVRPNDSYSFVSGLAGSFLLAEMFGGSIGEVVQGSSLVLDSIVREIREKDPDCAVFCGDPFVQAGCRGLERSVSA